MDIKIGLADSPRELTLRLSEEAGDVFATIESAIAQNTPTLRLVDEKGREYLVRTDRIAYVERGSATAHSVGFMR